MVILRRDGPTPLEASCGKCGEKHRTDQCTSMERKCVNCVRCNKVEVDHPVFYHKCPSLIKYQEEIQLKKNLNLRRNRADPVR